MPVIQPRRGSAAAWAASNRVLAQSEQGIETDTGRGKRGDGTTAYNLLPYTDAQSRSECLARIVGAAGYVPDFYKSFRKNANAGSASVTGLPVVADSMHPFNDYVGAGTNNQAFIKNGAMTMEATNAGLAANYVKTPSMGANITRIGCTFRFRPNPASSPTITGAGCMAVTKTAIAGTVPAMPLHYSWSPSNFALGWWPNAGDPGATNFFATTYASYGGTTLLVDGVTEYTTECYVDTVNNRIMAMTPDGGWWVSPITAGIATNFGQFGFFEPFANNAATDNYIDFLDIWCSTGPLQINYDRGVPVERVAATNASTPLPTNTQTFIAQLGTRPIMVPQSGMIESYFEANLQIPTASNTFMYQGLYRPNVGAVQSKVTQVDSGASPAGRNYSVRHTFTGLTPGDFVTVLPSVVNSSATGDAFIQINTTTKPATVYARPVVKGWRR